ncbi:MULTISPECIES: DUF6452 family protein [Flavobacterium]|uniref:Lipoprotein n=1 Tax=Flavobacterium salmonis TaxID=2654844 RepID=A0A6V6ZCD6_9FLAO|nr:MULTISPECIES: DUF6452 family protein [Flavobacterium]OOV16232.1 hypothetical protein BXU10_21875 [Flavobacterium sp. LM4]CAD0009453.1 hypothetical protein FLAT13_04935 [Flavobacterium salmonis]
MKKILYFLLIFTFGLSSCEKDDICDANTPTTPRLIISFYDITTPSVKKSVTLLKVMGKGEDEGIIFNESGTEITKYLTSGDSIAIPLKTNEDATTFSFILNSDESNPGLANTDEITFNYTRQNVYVSRACGFKTIYRLDTQTPFVRTDSGNDGIWMQDVRVFNPNIEFENETHVKVFF